MSRPLAAWFCAGLLVLLLCGPASAASPGGSPSGDPALQQYMEEIPTAGGTVGPGSSGGPPESGSLQAFLTSPSLGAPQGIIPLAGDVKSAGDESFPLATVRSVASVGIARLAVLLAALALISFAVAGTAVSRPARRRA